MKYNFIVLCAIIILSATFFACGTSFASSGKRVYFAGPLFCQAEKDYNLQLAKLLEDHGYKVFLPQRDGFEAAQFVGKSEDELTKMIFENDSGNNFFELSLGAIQPGESPDPLCRCRSSQQNDQQQST